MKKLINRKITLAFLIMGILVGFLVFQFLNRFLDYTVYDYLYNSTVSHINSYIQQFDEVMLEVEENYDYLLSRVLVDMGAYLEEHEKMPGTPELNSKLEDLLSKYEALIDMLGLTKEDVYFYIINPYGKITSTNDLDDLGLDFREYPNFWEELKNLNPNAIKKQRLTYSIRKGLPYKYAYLKLPSGYILELGVPFDQPFFETLISRFKMMEKEQHFIKEINLYDEYMARISGVFSEPTSNEEKQLAKLTEKNVVKSSLGDYQEEYYQKYTTNVTSPGEISQTYYIRILFDFSFFHELKTKLLYGIGVILLLTTTGLYLINIGVARSITAPFVELAENMSNLGDKGFEWHDEYLGRTEIDEVNTLFATYQEMTSELASTFEELESTNDKLKDSLQESKLLAEKLNQVIQVSTKLSEKALADEKEDFLKEIFYVAKDLIPEADYGSVYIVEEDKWRYIATIGHDLEKLKNLPLKKDYIPDGEDIEIIDNIFSFEYNKMPSPLLEEVVEASKPIASALHTKLWVGEELAGCISFEIARGEDKEFSRESVETLKAFGNLASAFLTMYTYKNVHQKFQKEIILAIINILELHDRYTKGHSENVSRIAGLIGKEMGFSLQEIKEIQWAGLLHDIGKILVSNDILNKPGPLSQSEYQEIKKHSVWGYKVLRGSKELENIACYVRHHHEHWDGSGYPDGLNGEEIPLISRILAVADAWDTMRSDRVYRKKLPLKEAVRELKKNRGSQFSPDVVDIALELIEKGVID